MNTEKINLLYGYPELTEKGKEQTQIIINEFKKQLEEIVNNTLYSFTCNLANEITVDDSWIDIRKQTKDALCNYQGTQGYSGVDWVQVRKVILEENRDSIINDIISDKEKELESWKQAFYREQQNNRY